MRALSKYNFWQNRIEVKFLQAWLNQFEGEQLSVDGSYGNLTVAAVKRFQTKNGLTVDGMAGRQTQEKMGFRTAKNNNIVLMEIPYNRITQANVLLRNGQGYTCERFAKEGWYDIVINGAFFQMSTRKIVQLVVQNGSVQQWGFGTKGIAFPNIWSEAFPVLTEVKNVINGAFDMEGGSPSLIYNYKLDMDGINAFKNPTIMTSKTRRNCLGITTSHNLVLMFTIGNCTLYEMANEAIYQKLQYVIGNDGGGSQSIYMGGATVIPTDGRLIPAGIGFKVR